jgi:diguanylate cyclase (GGDEF)-like protein
MNQDDPKFIHSELKKVLNKRSIQKVEVVASELKKLSPTERSLVEVIVTPEAVTERRNLERLAFTDALTGVASREAFNRAQASAEAAPEVSFVFFDGDKFGLVNKREGQLAGDEVLKRMAAVISRVAARYGVGERVFRVGGDEFMVLSPTLRAKVMAIEAVHEFGSTQYAGFTYQGVEVPAFSVGITAAIGSTYFEAQANLQELKAAG